MHQIIANIPTVQEYNSSVLFVDLAQFREFPFFACHQLAIYQTQRSHLSLCSAMKEEDNTVLNSHSIRTYIIMTNGTIAANLPACSLTVVAATTAAVAQ